MTTLNQSTIQGKLPKQCENYLSNDINHWLKAGTLSKQRPVSSTKSNSILTPINELTGLQSEEIVNPDLDVTQNVSLLQGTFYDKIVNFGRIPYRKKIKQRYNQPQSNFLQQLLHK